MAQGAMIGMRVQARDGEAGIVEDILTTEDGKPTYVVVRNRGIFGGSAVLPISAGTIMGNSIRFDMTRAEIKAADQFDQNRYGESAGLYSTAAKDYDRRVGDQ
jgi:hypothetical protein